MKNRTGAIVSGVVALLAIVGLVAAFVTNASPYVTVAQAKSASGESLHLAGEIIPGSLENQMAQGVLKFRVRDAEGNEAPVEYRGSAVSNLNEAKQVVVVGSMKEGVFKAHKMLVKCPSRYEGEKKA
ncbi:MAG: cytochrome c maturation protein CcmE [Fimbriimonadaceae bacterium]|nr:cytochrome c maturation protein CcmE [Fimbriimonadaceae bacterium]